MSIRREVADFAALGRLPDSSADEDVVAAAEALLTKVRPPVSDEEAAVLIKCFGPDDCHGLAWTLLHLIESAPHGAPLQGEPGDDDNEWLKRLRARAHR